MARTDPTIYMRLPPELKSRLDAAAMANHCSLTSEVVRRLEASFASDGVSRPPALAAQVALPLESPGEHKAQLLTELEALHQEASSIHSLIEAVERAEFMAGGDANAVEAKRLHYEQRSLRARMVVLEHRIKSIQREIDLLERFSPAG